MEEKRIRSIHLVGIKGVGMAPLAIIAKEAGLTVTGCDIDEEFITDEPLRKAGILPLVGFSKEHVAKSDLVITTGAHGGFDNPEVQHAKYTGIPVMTQGEAVGKFMAGDIVGRKDLIGVSVAGSHGKTTTTAMLATIFRESGLDPSFLIGTGDVPSLGSPGHFGKGRYFIAEADEYATEPTYDKTPKFLWQHPKIAIFTNIELDHPDLYPSIDAIRGAFLQFARNIRDGVLVVGGDDSQNKKLIGEYGGRVITFGKHESNDFVLKKVSVSGPQTFFWVESHQTSLGQFVLKVAGEHNALNALGAIVGSLEAGISIDKIRVALSKFTGTKRRAEHIGRLDSGALLYDDYAHHPTEIKKTLLAFKQSYPKLKIVCIFQPHTYSRTKILFEEFTHSFFHANTVIITNIYPSLREKPDPEVSSRKLVESVRKIHSRALFLPDQTSVIEYVKRQQYGEGTIIMTMGAGDIYKIAEAILANGK